MSRISFDPTMKAGSPRCLDRSTARICVMGGVGVGKTSLIIRWLRGCYDVIEKGTYSEDLYHRTLLLNEYSKKYGLQDEMLDDGDDCLRKYAALDVQILDCDFVDMTYDNRELLTAQIKQSDAFVLCFEPSSRESFESLSGLFARIEENTEKPLIEICSTKCDLYLDAEIKIEEVAERMEAVGYSLEEDYMEVSAKTGAHVDELFCTMLRKIRRHKKQARLQYKQEQQEQQEQILVVQEVQEHGEVLDTPPSMTKSSLSVPSLTKSAKGSPPLRAVASDTVPEENIKTKNTCCVIC